MATLFSTESIIVNVSLWSPSVLFDFDTDFLACFQDLYFYHPQRSCGKVVFLHLSVILFTGEGGVCHSHPSLGRHLSRQTTPPQSGKTPSWADTTPLHSACWETVNKWAVCIAIGLHCCCCFFVCGLGKQHVSFFSYHSGTSGFTKSSGSSTRVAFKAETLQLPRCKITIALITVNITWEFYSIVQDVNLLNVITRSGFKSLRTMYPWIRSFCME